MKLTKKTEAEVIKVYDAWLNAYLNGDVKTYDFFLDDIGLHKHCPSLLQTGNFFHIW